MPCGSVYCVLLFFFVFCRPVWARGHCRISPPRFLAACLKRQLNQGSFVFCCILGCLLFLICIEFVFSCTVLFVSISQVIGCEDRLRNDLYCVGWGVKLYSNQTITKSQAISIGSAELRLQQLIER